MKYTCVFTAILGVAIAVPLASETTISSEDKTLSTTAQQPLFLEQAIDRNKPKTPGGKITVIKYGPYKVAAMSMLENHMEIRIKQPCQGCYITALQADLLDKNGKSTNINEGAWLHHMALTNTGFQNNGSRDPICDIMPQRIFASGNERTPIRLNGNGKFGIEFKPTDQMMMIIELMNESKQDQEYWIEMTYEHISYMDAKDYKPVKVAWLDIGGCLSGGEVPAREGVYELESEPWASIWSGKLLTATGHSHDGGQEVVIYKNGQPVCTTAQLYGRRPAWVGGMSGLPHISDTGTCLQFGEVKVGDKLSVGARYNTTANALDKAMDGSLHPIMGISVVYIG